MGAVGVCEKSGLAALTVVLLLTAACAPSGAPQAAGRAASPAKFTRSETVIFDISGGRVVDPKLWHPMVPGSRRDQGYHQAILEPLFILNYQTGELMPWLGESMTSNQTQDVWTLRLRQGVEWSDGEVFDADDVVYTVNLLLDNAPSLTYSAGLRAWVDNVEKIDPLNVRFTLTKPNPRFQLDNWSVKIWGGPQILPEHIWRDKDPLTFKFYDPEQGWPIGTGPYKLAGVSPTEFVYVRDDKWWGAKTGFRPLPKPRKLIWNWAGPEETRTALMADGQLDSLMDITLGALFALRQRNPNVITWFDDLPYAWVPDPCSRTFELNHTLVPWNDRAMRWALSYAVDRDEIVKIAYEGTTLKSRHFFPAYPPLDRYVDLAIEAGAWNLERLWRHDPEEARKVFASKGWALADDGYYYKEGRQLSLDITTHEAAIEKQRIAQVLVEQFQRIGINATNRNEAGATWSEKFAFGHFEARLGWQTCGSVNEPWASMNTMNTRWLQPVGERADDDEWRWSGDAADKYSYLVDEIGSLPLGDPKIDELFVEAMQIWFRELPVIPITQARKIIPFNTTYWTNWPTYQNDYVHPPTWWQHTHFIIHQLVPAKR